MLRACEKIACHPERLKKNVILSACKKIACHPEPLLYSGEGSLLISLKTLRRRSTAAQSDKMGLIHKL